MSSTHSHLMKTTKRGRPFVKDTHDLYCTLIISLPLETHRHFFKSYPNSFTTDEAASNLGSLKFSQSNRAADPKDPGRIVTTTTTTTFSMSRDMAKGICQHFLDARLIENAADLESKTFRDRGVYITTPKGLHVLERFITKNGITAEQTIRIFADQPICMKLLHLERRSVDDDIIITKSVVEVLWRRFVGREPNVSSLTDDEIAAQVNSRWYAKSSVAPGEEIDLSVGMILRKNALPTKEKRVLDEFTFTAKSAIDWMCEYSTCVGEDEAGDILAQYVRYGYMTLHSDKGKMKESNFIATARGGGAGGGAGAPMAEAEFRATDKAIYNITKEGMLAAKWEIPGLSPRPSANTISNASKPNLQSTDHNSSLTTTKVPQRRSSHANDDKSAPVLINKGGPQERLRNEATDSPGGGMDRDAAKDSHAARLRQILDEPALRSLFREFLRANFCEENLSFWLDTQDFKRKFNTTSSAVANPAAGQGRTIGHQAMEKHQQELIGMAFVIYNTYLAPASPCELNIDHNLRAELIAHMNQITADKDAGIKGHVEPGVGNVLHASQLQTMIRLYERIQTYIYRLMATDSVPKFCKTERFLSLMRTLFDYNEKFIDNEASDHRLGLGGNEGSSPTRAYLTISQAANEKLAALEKQRDLEKERQARALLR